MFRISKPQNWESLPLYKKIQHYKTQLDERFAPYVDKIEAKEIVKEMCGDEIKCANIIRILDSPNDISEKDLNINHMIKSAHGSAWNIVIHSNSNIYNIKYLLHSWNIHYTGICETHYQYITPRFYIEEKIDDKYTGKSGSAVVFMFRCIHGKPITIGIKKGDIQNMYYISGKSIEINFEIEFPTDEIEKMKILSEKLSTGFEFVRIDFYLSQTGDIYFSEFTFTPAGGKKLYSNELEEQFGKLWT